MITQEDLPILKEMLENKYCAMQLYGCYFSHSHFCMDENSIFYYKNHLAIAINTLQQSRQGN